MTVQIDVEGRIVQFSLDWENSIWHSSEELEQAVFPLITTIDGKRYELYSDETFAEVEK